MNIFYLEKSGLQCFKINFSKKDINFRAIHFAIKLICREIQPVAKQYQIIFVVGDLLQKSKSFKKNLLNHIRFTPEVAVA